MVKQFIGTGQDQVSVNGMLGDLAFQSKEAVNFTNGYGSLSELSLNAIYKEITATATDVFIYDTRKDSDGGAWRKRCQNTSWYNEDLNTTVRGSRREFPAVAIIVGYTGGVNIYDGDDPDLPLWMSFTHNGSGTNFVGWGTNVVKSVYMLNGVLCIGTNLQPSANYGGLTITDFIADAAWVFLGTEYHKFGTEIKDRNNGNANSWWWSDGRFTAGLVDGFVNDVAMAVMPDAPIDPVSQIQRPTILAGCSTGLSVITHTGTVISRANSWRNDGGVFEVTFDKRGGYWYSNAYYAEWNSGVSNHAGLAAYVGNIYETGNLANSSNVSATNGVQYLLGSPNPINNQSHWGTTAALWLVNSWQNANAGKMSFTNGDHVGTQYGLNTFSTDPINPSTGMVAYTASNYATGWLPGRIRGAWLCDTSVAETMSNNNVGSGYNVVANWTRQASISASVSGNTITFNGNGTGANVYYFLPITVEANTWYTFNITFGSFNVTSFTINTNQYGMGGNLSSYFGAANSSYTYTFNSGSNTTVYLQSYQASASPTQITSFELVKTDMDRSVFSLGMVPYGSVVKTPVAAGSDLMAYSNFGTSNYLRQGYTNALDFGTGDFTFMVWALPINRTATYGTQALFTRSSTSGTTKALGVYMENSNWAIFVGSGSNTQTPMVYDQWQHIAVTRRSGTVTFYLNGVASGGVFPSSVTTDFTDTSAVLTVGKTSTNALPSGSDNKLALLRYSATGITKDQVVKIYNDEKVLFRENAKASLYGTSDVVNALAFDDLTGLLHVGTSSGRSVFQGLRRVDYSTTAVDASISASNGLVVEE